MMAWRAKEQGAWSRGARRSSMAVPWGAEEQAGRTA